MVLDVGEAAVRAHQRGQRAALLVGVLDAEPATGAQQPRGGDEQAADDVQAVGAAPQRQRRVVVGDLPRHPRAVGHVGRVGDDEVDAPPFWGPDFAALAARPGDRRRSSSASWTGCAAACSSSPARTSPRPAVLAALGSTLTNKYAEGYPGRRYYGGCEVVDRAEEIGIDRAKELFGAEHANLQPHSGASANLAAYAAFLQPGDTVLAMELPHGGHLTHGAEGELLRQLVQPGALRRCDPDTELIDYDQVRDLAARAPAQDDHLRRLRRIPRLIDFARVPRDRRRGRRVPDGRRGALHRAGRRQGDPVARCPTPTSSPSPPTRCCAARAAA